MFKNYLKVAFRNLRRDRYYAIINILGLALGMACFLVIMRHIQFQMSYDSFHKNKDRIYRILGTYRSKVNSTERTVSGTSAILAPFLEDNLPFVERTVRFVSDINAFVTDADHQFKEDIVLFADASVFDVFTFPLKVGDPRTALSEPFTMVVTPKFAQKYFGDQDPIGQIFYFKQAYGEMSMVSFHVTGILEELPENSHIDIQFLMSYSSLNTLRYEGFFQYYDWGQYENCTYILLNDNVPVAEAEEQLQELLRTRTLLTTAGGHRLTGLTMQPLEEVYFDQTQGPFLGKRGVWMYEIILSILALIVLSVAVINFVNLSTARATLRATEVGIRKVFGSNHTQLVQQFLGEAFVSTCIALLCSLLLVELFTRGFNRIVTGMPFLGEYMQIPYTNGWLFFLTAIITAIFTVVLSGSYPAFYLARFQPTKVLKAGTAGTTLKSRLRNTLVVVQFTISIIVLTLTFVVQLQIHFMRHRELGFNPKNIVWINAIDSEVRQRFPELKSALLQQSGVENVSASSIPLGLGISPRTVRSSSAEELEINAFNVAPNFFNMLEFNVLHGKVPHMNEPNQVFVDQSVINAFRWDQPVGKRLEYMGRTYTGEERFMTVSGSFKDIYIPGDPSELPRIIGFDLTNARAIYIKLDDRQQEQTVQEIAKVWRRFDFDMPFEYTYLEDDVRIMLSSSEATGTFATYASIFTIFVAALGLLGVVTYVLQRKTKEIGIRRVVGASVIQIVTEILTSFLKVIIIAVLVALPISFYLARMYLQSYAARIDLTLWLLLMPSVAVFVIVSIITVGQAIRAATANPVESLRYE